MAGRPKRGSLARSFVSAGLMNVQLIPSAPLTAASIKEEEANTNLKAQQDQTQQQQNATTGNGTTATEVMNVESENTVNAAGDDSDGEKKPFFRRFLVGVRKKPSVRAREKKIRQNRRLRKVLVPKNALMALHEVKGVKISDFVLNSRPGGGFTAEVTVNNIQYEGHGPSKNVAKNNASEKALRDLIISKMIQKLSKHESLEKLGDASSGETQEGESEDVQMKESEEDDDVPMVNLASFALYKLFSDWENEGFEVPEFRPHSAPPAAPQVEKPKKPWTIRNELPPNWEIMHPTTLLCMMRPGIIYTDLGSEGRPPNTTQKMGVIVDGENFIGSGRSKKIARRNVAVSACNQIFGTNFVQEEI